jgi:two-component sensor histidine kinase
MKVNTTALPDKVNILLVDDQPGKLMSYELILTDLGQNLLKASSAKEALELLLKNDVAVILVDVCMPDLDGFELAQMIRDHPRFTDTAIIFISAINVTELDSLRGYELGAVDYVPVPVVPGVLRAKVRVFVDLHLKTRALAHLNDELERRVADRTAQLETAIAHQELLAREVDHRARNALAVIQSIVSLTPSADGAEFSGAIKGRIRAMATAHNLLSASRWRGADLLRLVHEELAPFEESGRIEVTGDAVSIAPAVAQNLALALHELATNAAKYGALSGLEGQLSVSWRLEDDHLRVDWVETCAAPILEPSRSGFGSKVIEASIKGQLRGVIERSWLPTGLKCSFTVPGEHFSAPVRSAYQPRETMSVNGDGEPRHLRGMRILILEDEPLIAMMTSRIVRELEAEVVGPFASINEASRALDTPVDAALLDVNVGGQLVYGFADKIRNAGAPIIFVTGYQAGAIDPRFADALVLTKPVDSDDLAAALAGARVRRERSDVH